LHRHARLATAPTEPWLVGFLSTVRRGPGSGTGFVAVAEPNINPQQRDPAGMATAAEATSRGNVRLKVMRRWRQTAP